MSESLHVILGMDPEEWEAAMAAGRKTVGWKGMPAIAEPRYHAHPALGIIGHSHSQTEEARRPHVHRPVVEWDHTPIFVAYAPPMLDGPINVYGAENTGYVPTLAEYAAVVEALSDRGGDVPDHLERAYTDAMRRAALAHVAATMREAADRDDQR